MAELHRMTTDEVVSYFLEGEGVDLLRESLLWVCQQLMEAEVSELDRRRQVADAEIVPRQVVHAHGDADGHERMVTAAVGRRLAAGSDGFHGAVNVLELDGTL